MESLYKIKPLQWEFDDDDYFECDSPEEGKEFCEENWLKRILPALEKVESENE